MMRRALGSLAIVLGLLLGSISAAPVAASTPQGAVSWKVDDAAKMITVSVRLQIYSACDRCPGAVNQFLADKMRKQILDVWNRHRHYRCYELIFEVDIKLGTDRFRIESDRVGVRIDNSPVDIRSFVMPEKNDTDRWQSNDPADRIVPVNDVFNPTTWRESANRDWTNTYAHEFGHVIGLSDAYRDQKDPGTGKLISVPLPGAPLDLMSDGRSFISQETINRAVERSPVDRSKLKCGWNTERASQGTTYKGVKCPDLGGEWVIQGEIKGSGVAQTLLFNVTIDAQTLHGTYAYEAITQIAGGTGTINGKGQASIVLGADGTVDMTLLPTSARSTVTAAGTKVTTTILVPSWAFVWKPNAGKECP